MSYIGNQPQYTSFLSDTFSGNGSTTQFTMTVAPANTAAVLVAIWGVLQDPTTYGVVGRILTFSQAPPAGTDNISVRYLALPASNITTTSYRSVSEFTATAGQTTFTPASYTPGFISVFRSGVRLGASNYTATNGVTVVLNNAAAAGDLITIESFFVSAVLNAIPNVAGAITPTLLDSTSQSGSGALQIPTGTTAQRPTSPTNGMIRKNSTTGFVEYWDPATSSWIALGEFNATGGTITEVGGFRYHTFTTSGSFLITSGSKSIDYLIVAGGGGGGISIETNPFGDGAGGGGAGGLLFGTRLGSVGTYDVVVGGAGSISNRGGNSSALGFTAIGGGGGGDDTNNANFATAESGGSGGGAATECGGAASGGAGTTGQGFAGGNSDASCSIRNGGGGGGRTAVGGAGNLVNTSGGGAGGAGYTWVNGSTYAGGGGGGCGGNNNNGRGAAGSGGGGAGALISTAATSGTANTGGGGGGSSAGGAPGQAGIGGSGVVIIRYAI
jgi:hypothetical protein